MPDHAPIILSLCLPGIPQSSRSWRFNSTLLADEDFVKFIEKEIKFFLDTNISPETSNLIVWDAHLWGQIISYTANLKRRSTKERMDLSNRIKEIDKQYAQTKDHNLLREQMELKSKLELLLTYSIELMLLKDKAHFYMHGKKNK